MYKNETLADINRNPLNIRFNPNNKWQGQTGENRGFCVFSSEAYGIRAGFRILTSYLRWGINTIEDIVRRWAPPCENDTERYIAFVSNETIIPKDHVLTDKDIHDYWTKIIILQAMIKMECGRHIDEQTINLYINYPERY